MVRLEQVGTVGNHLRGDDGTGFEAGFCDASGAAVDRNGTVYVADVFNDTIRKTTLAGAGSVWRRQRGNCVS